MRTLQDAIQGPFRKKKQPSPPGLPSTSGPAVSKVAAVPKHREVENLQTDVQIRYLSSRQLEEAAQAERYLLENMDRGSDFKNLFYLKHQFLIAELEQPSFCDLCGLLIWGVYRLSLKCRSKSHDGNGNFASRSEAQFYVSAHNCVFDSLID
jgi:hypothetical protein